MSNRTLSAAGGTVFESILGAMLPLGGAAMVVEAYFDESIGTVPGRQILCVAGYLMTDRFARRLSREWQAVLREYDLPFFRMSACAHGNRPFDRLSLADRIAVETRMIGLIKRRTIMGMAVTVDIGEYEKHMPRSPLLGSAYTFLVHVVVGGVIHWLEEKRAAERVAYFFESGHASQAEAQQIMNRIFTTPNLKSASHYGGHAFLDKRESPPCQAADLLAWQWYTDIRRALGGQQRRLDCRSLMDHSHSAVHVSAAKMLELVEKWGAKSGESPSSALASLILGERRDG